MNRISIALFILISAVNLQAKSRDISPILDSNQFDISYTTKSISAEAWSSFSSFDSDITMANPKEPVNLGCIRVPGLPNKALVFAGKNKAYEFILFMEGGLVIRYNFVLFEKKIKGVTLLWHGVLHDGVVKDFTDLKTALHQKKFVMN